MFIVELRNHTNDVKVDADSFYFSGNDGTGNFIIFGKNHTFVAGFSMMAVVTWYPKKEVKG